MRDQRPRLLRILRVRARRLVARLDRRAAVLLVWVPSWGTSLLIHGLLILMLALYFYAWSGRREGDAELRVTVGNQLTEDLTSLHDSDHAGDPFTALKSEEPPSLSLTPPEPDVKLFNQPEVPRLAHFAPVVAGPERMGALLRDELARWKRVVAAAKSPAE